MNKSQGSTVTQEECSGLAYLQIYVNWWVIGCMIVTTSHTEGAQGSTAPQEGRSGLICLQRYHIYVA